MKVLPVTKSGCVWDSPLLHGLHTCYMCVDRSIVGSCWIKLDWTH